MIEIWIMDNELLKFAKKIIENNDEIIREKEEEARIFLIFEERFKPLLIEYIDSNISQAELHFTKKVIMDEANNYDIRCKMNDDMINEVAGRGYSYRQDLSNSDELVFLKSNFITNDEP